MSCARRRFGREARRFGLALVVLLASAFQVSAGEPKIIAGPGGPPTQASTRAGGTLVVRGPYVRSPGIQIYRTPYGGSAMYPAPGMMTNSSYGYGGYGYGGYGYGAYPYGLTMAAPGFPGYGRGDPSLAFGVNAGIYGYGTGTAYIPAYAFPGYGIGYGMAAPAYGYGYRGFWPW